MPMQFGRPATPYIHRSSTESKNSPIGAAAAPKVAAAAVKKAILAALAELGKIPPERLPEMRYAKFRAMGSFR